ncbi:ricin B lectin domain-containing protein [Mycena leptocephala]|nr:ricin B lectin domain-containing protein [Mycena leptocephala]
MIEDCNVGIPSQLWTIFGSTLQIFGNKCLDVTGGATADGTKMQIWTCTGGDTNRQWTISGNSIQWSGHSSCLDLTDGSVANNNTMQIWACTGGINQKWTASTALTLFPTLNILPGASSTTCLTAPTKVNGGTVVVEPCVSGSEAQAWEVNGPTLIVYGSMCLDVTGGNTTNGVKMQIWSCTPGGGDAAQHFTLTADSRIQWANTAECLDLTGGSLTSGNQVQMWACAAGNTNQVWNI